MDKHTVAVLSKHRELLAENRTAMYSFNHSVRYCSILNLHILITQMVLLNQSKHMDAVDPEGAAEI